MHKIVTAKNVNIANNLPFILIAGPCQIENLDHALLMAESISKVCHKLDISLIYKSSFDKANRTSLQGARGAGIDKGLEILSKIATEFNCPIITDVHNEAQCAIVSEVADILQIPAFLCRQTDLLKSASDTGRIINVKKGQFLAPWDMKNVHDKLTQLGAKDILLTERGASFGYNNLISDMRSLDIMAKTGAPVVFDATHSVQQPGGLGDSSGGARKYVELLARAAVSVGVAAVFLEVHQDPDNAPSDGPCMIKLENLEQLLINLKRYDQITKNL